MYLIFGFETMRNILKPSAQADVDRARTVMLVHYVIIILVPLRGERHLILKNTFSIACMICVYDTMAYRFEPIDPD